MTPSISPENPEQNDSRGGAAPVHEPDRLTDVVLDAALGPNPLVAPTARQTVAAFGRWATHAARRPSAVASVLGDLARDERDVILGNSAIRPSSQDRRFSDPAWHEGPHRRLMQAYLAFSKAAYRAVDAADLDAGSAARGRFAMSLVAEGAAPSNGIITNPVVLRRAIGTRGRSLMAGGRNLLADIRENGGMPALSDSRAFRVGEDLATSPGAVIWRNELAELLQYSPRSTRVATRPVLLVPSQVNKYYVLDLSTGRSFVEHCVGRGVQFFALSWRSPSPANRDWSIDTYTQAVIEAVDVVLSVTRSRDCHLVGLCAGGFTTAAAASVVRARGERTIASATFLLSMLDSAGDSGPLSQLASSRSAEARRQRADRRGIVSSAELSRIFAWLNPNALVWNLVESSWLLGHGPPRNEILFWTADQTNLPAALYRDFTRLSLERPLVPTAHEGLSVLGSTVDLKALDIDVYVLGARDDHICPWQGVYGSTHLFGSAPRFVLSSGGHIRCLVTPPDSARSSFFTSADGGADAAGWLASAEEHEGSWWDDWVNWVLDRSGPLRPAPRRLGSSLYPPQEPAPGSYVHS